MDTLKNIADFVFKIHGDNIVECERTLLLIIDALNSRTINVDGPFGSAVCPSFHLELVHYATPMTFTFLPGFGRWSQDILALVRDRGGPIREVADAILTRVTTPTSEEPLIAIEYCGALPAGNQAWQRNGRAYSFARAGIPYVYIAELGGYELGAGRSRKATRLPNPAVPFSYLTLAASLNTPVIPVFVPSPGASEAAITAYSDIFGRDDLLKLIRNLISGRDYKESKNSLEHKALELVKLLASNRKRSDTLTPAKWEEAYEFILSGGTLAQYSLQKAPMSWAKTAYISSLTSSAKDLMALAAMHAVGLSSTNLPVCVIPAVERGSFVRGLVSLYPGLPLHFIQWLSKQKDLTISWVMGFKPRGDDARPDRGLAPMARMLIGEDSDLLTVVYGPAPVATWDRLNNDPVNLMQQNGLWEAILTVSDAILIDSRTAANTQTRAFLRTHWEAGIPTQKTASILVELAPERIGENDVDTVLHLLFSHLGRTYVFEGMCNPPGGDWSGMSVLTTDKSIELRWLSLPRVTASDAKRPDHLFQVFDIYSLPIVLVIESKERANQVESNIGPRLVKYATELTSTTPSVQRAGPDDSWVKAATTLPRNSVQFASAVAFVMNKETELKGIANRAKSDLILGLDFSEGGGYCTINSRACTKLGQTLKTFMQGISSASANITVRKL